MKARIVTTAAVFGTLFAACGAQRFSSSSVASRIDTSHRMNTQDELRQSFESCLVSTFEANHRMPFEKIKDDCRAAGLARCQGEASCEAAFEVAIHETMTHGRSVDCDSGYCTILY